MAVYPPTTHELLTQLLNTIDSSILSKTQEQDQKKTIQSAIPALLEYSFEENDAAFFRIAVHLVQDAPAAVKHITVDLIHTAIHAMASAPSRDIALLGAELLTATVEAAAMPDLYLEMTGRILASLHCLLDVLQSFVENNSTVSVKGDYTLDNFDSDSEHNAPFIDPISSPRDFEQRYEALCYALQCLLTSQPSFNVPLHPRSVFLFVQRVFTIEIKTEHLSNDNDGFASVLTNAHRFAVHVVGALVVGASFYITNYISALSHFLLEELSMFYRFREHHVEIIRDLYKVLGSITSIWGVTVYKPLCEPLLGYILRDMDHIHHAMLPDDQLQLLHFETSSTPSAGNRNAAPPRKRRRTGTGGGSSPKDGTTMLQSSHVAIGYQSIEQLHHILDHCGAMLSAPILDRITQRIVRLLRTILGVGRGAGVARYMMHKPLTVTLLETLLAALLSTRTVDTQSPYVSYAMRLFRVGMNTRILKYVLQPSPYARHSSILVQHLSSSLPRRTLMRQPSGTRHPFSCPRIRTRRSPASITLMHRRHQHR
eukprot:gb/GECH01010011.1/.p1 GENE.gb/GECH01010011.1/~~gb/GECH01010011.1/.p1  ORF type:complete len:540 (+),score=131.97 gb/GECH01010011.1/:1-1620(+)